MKETERKLIEEALAIVRKSSARGITAEVADGTCYALVQIPKDFKLPEGCECRWMVSDGTRLWYNPPLVQEIDILSDDLATRRFYIKKVPKIKLQDYTPVSMLRCRPEILPSKMPITETVIFDHRQRDKNGRPSRIVIEGDIHENRIPKEG